MKHFVYYVSLFMGCSLLRSKCQEQTYLLASSCGSTVQEGHSCTLTCNTVTEQLAILWDDGGSQAIFQYRYTCHTSYPSLPNNYGSACPNSTAFTIFFTNAESNRDSKTWKCLSPDGRNASNEIQIDVTGKGNGNLVCYFGFDGDIPYAKCKISNGVGLGLVVGSGAILLISIAVCCCRCRRNSRGRGYHFI